VYAIEFTPSAVKDLKALRKAAQRAVLDGIEAQLMNEPVVETRNRKSLRPNQIAEWELRLGRFRVLYNVDEDAQLVAVQAIGYKVGGELYIRGETRKI
jgi:mRNA-degrading endonuclease RelE of RelBE toxin-antitoxin system